MNAEKKPRGRKARYEFHLRRHGDEIEATDDKARTMVLSAFINWKRNRPGTLKATSRAQGGIYVIRFEGISPAEATAARLAAQEDLQCAS